MKTKMKMMINPLYMMALFIASLFVHTTNAQSGADDILGRWVNEDKTRVIEFVKNGSSYEAIIREAPDKQLLGKKQITDLQYKSGTYKGNLYLPKRGKTFACTINLNSDGTLKLSARSGLMSQSQTWSRMKE